MIMTQLEVEALTAIKRIAKEFERFNTNFEKLLESNGKK